MAKQPKNLLSNFGNVAKDNSQNVDIKEEKGSEDNVNSNSNDNSNVNVNNNVNEDVNSNSNVSINDNNNVTYPSNKNNNDLDNKNEKYLDNDNNHENEEQTDNLVDNIRVNDPKRKYTKPKTVLDVLVDQKKTKKQMAFYLDHDVAEAIDRLNTLGKGRIKSTFVNEVLRDALKREGLL